MARIGGNINAFTSKECTSYYATTLSQHLPIAIRIIGDMLNNSLFDEKALRKEKSVIIEEIDMYEDSPEDLAHELLQQRIWKGHPLGYMISGKKTIVRKIIKDQILDFMDSYYTGENIVISIAGSFNQREILSLVEEEFGKIKAKSTKLIKSPDKPRYHKVVCKRNKDIEQLHINIAFDGISYLSDERFTLSVLNCIFGGSVNSRLFQKIREDEGLTYSIYSYGSSYKDTGLLHIYAAMNPNQKDMVIDMIYNEIYQLKSKGITKDELIMTKEQIKTELILGSEGARNRMNSNGKSMLNRGRIVSINELIDNIEKVSLDDVKSFANRYLDLSNSSISLVGNLK
jgi:predicted Zn-dependent peptidase